MKTFGSRLNNKANTPMTRPEDSKLIGEKIERGVHRAYVAMLREKALHGWPVVVVRNGEIVHLPAQQLLDELAAEQAAPQSPY